MCGGGNVSQHGTVPDLGCGGDPTITSCWTRYLPAATIGKTVPGLFLAMEEAMCHSVSQSQGPQIAGPSGSLWTLPLSQSPLDLAVS